MPIPYIIERDGSRAKLTIQPTKYFNFTATNHLIKESGASGALDTFADDYTTLTTFVYLGGEPFRLRSYMDGDQFMLIVQPPDDAPPPDDAALDRAAEWANRRFALDLDLEKATNAIAAVDDYGAEIVARSFPARPANYSTAWEALLKSLVHAQIFPGFAAKLDDYLRSNYGSKFTFDGETVAFFPSPEQLAPASVEELRAAKFSQQKAEYLVAVARALIHQPERYDFERLRTLSGEEAVAILQELHGVGPWVSQNVAMRGLPHMDVFIEEKATKAALTPYYGREGKISKQQFADAAAKFAPYRAVACYYTYFKHYGGEG